MSKTKWGKSGLWGGGGLGWPQPYPNRCQLAITAREDTGERREASSLLPPDARPDAAFARVTMEEMLWSNCDEI